MTEMTKTKIPFKDFLFEKFSDWEKKQPGKRSTYTAFADYLSENSLGIKVKQQLVSGWINGEFEPGEKYAPVLAERLGDEVFDLIDIPRPDPLLQGINSRWDRISSDRQQKLAELSEKFEAESLKNDRSKNVSKQRKTTQN